MEGVVEPIGDVLVIEDIPEVAETTAAVLRGEGLRVQVALTLDEALALCDVNYFDAVVLDHDLGDATAHDFLQEHLDIGPVVVVSAALAETLEGLRHNYWKVFAVRSKPCDPPDLIDVVKEAVAEGRRIRT